MGCHLARLVAQLSQPPGIPQRSGVHRWIRLDLLSVAFWLKQAPGSFFLDLLVEKPAHGGLGAPLGGSSLSATWLCFGADLGLVSAQGIHTRRASF